MKKAIYSVLMYEFGMSVVLGALGIYQENDFQICILLQVLLGVLYIVTYIISERLKRGKND